MFGMKETNKFILFFLCLTIIIILIFNLVTLRGSYVTYQKESIQSCQDSVNTIIDSKKEAQFEEEFNALKSTCSYELILKRGNTVVYTSNSLTDFAQADHIYDENITFRSTYAQGKYVAWFAVISVNPSSFLNTKIIISTMLSLTLFGVLIAIILYIYRRIAIPFINTYRTITDLRENYNNRPEISNRLDKVTYELLLLFSQLRFETASVEEAKKSLEVLSMKQTEILEEQNNYLKSFIHDIKSPMASIHNSAYLLSRVTDLDGKAASALSNIQNQTQDVTDEIVTTLNIIRNNSQALIQENDTVIVDKYIVDYFKKYDATIKDKNLNIQVNGSCTIVTNALTFKQVINSLLNNMIIYANEYSTLECEILDNTIIFKNAFGNFYNPTSTKLGIETCTLLAKRLGYKIEKSIEGEIFTVTVTYTRGDNNA